MNETVRKFVLFGAGPVFSAIINIVTVPLLSWLLLPGEYAKAILSLTSLNLVSLLCLGGLDQAFVRNYHEVSDVGKLVFHTLGVTLVLCCAVVLFMALNWNAISVYLYDSIDVFAGVILLAHLFVLVACRYYFLLVRMDERAGLYSLLTIAQAVLNLVFILAFIYSLNVNDFKSVLFAAMLSQVFVLLLLMCNSKKFRILVWRFEIDYFKPLFDYSWPLVISAVFMWALYSSDQWVLKHLSGLEELGIYSVAYKIASVGVVLQALITIYWVPLSLKWYRSGAPVERYGIVAEIFCLLFMLMFIILVYCRGFLSAVLAPEYLAAIDVFPYILAYPLMYTLSEVLSVGITFTRKNKYLVAITAICAIVNVVVNFLMIPKWGALGAGYATAIAFVLYLLLRVALGFMVWSRFQVSNVVLMIVGMIFVLLVIGSPFENIALSMFLLLLLLIALFGVDRWRSLVS